jgi:regulator of protease activity HflC (stomatin/prohibitin superfamily)
MHDAYRAFYSLTNPEGQMQAIVHDLIRKTIPDLGIDDIFVSKDMTLDILRCMQQAMSKYGFSIVDVLVKYISPDGRVKNAMNEINASKRLKEAVSHKAEAGG